MKQASAFKRAFTVLLKRLYQLVNTCWIIKKKFLDSREKIYYNSPENLTRNYSEKKYESGINPVVKSQITNLLRKSLRKVWVLTKISKRICIRSQENLHWENAEIFTWVIWINFNTISFWTELNLACQELPDNQNYPSTTGSGFFLLKKHRFIID